MICGLCLKDISETEEKVEHISKSGVKTVRHKKCSDHLYEITLKLKTIFDSEQ